MGKSRKLTNDTHKEELRNNGYRMIKCLDVPSKVGTALGKKTKKTKKKKKISKNTSKKTTKRCCDSN